MQHILSALVSAMASGLGYLISRWLTQARADEILKRRLSVLALHREMKAAGLDRAALRKLEEDLSE